MGIQPIRKHVAPEIPDKLYFRIGDVARLCEVPAYVLRFWETEFPQLKPNKGGTGQRLYRKRDVEMALRIKSLLYDQGYTIPGARQVFKDEAKAREAAAAETMMPAPGELAPGPAVAAGPAHTAVDAGDELRRKAALRVVREEICALLAMLEQPLLERSAPRTNRTAATEAKAQAGPTLQVMRPRLVLEARPPAVEKLRLVVDPQDQGDLFSGD